jgi:hypothetical protein
MSGLEKFLEGSISDRWGRTPEMRLIRRLVSRYPNAISINLSTIYSMSLNEPLFGSKW